MKGGLTRKEGQPIENELTSPSQERLIGEGDSAGLPFDRARRDTTEVLSSTLEKEPGQNPALRRCK
jgi:hypothetical protein